MTPTRRRKPTQPGEPTEPVGGLVLEWERQDVGRFYRALFTDTPANRRRLRALKAMFTALYDGGRRDLLRAMLRRQLDPREVLAAFQQGDLSTLPRPDQLAPLAPALEAWLAETATQDLRDIRGQVQRLLQLPVAARMADLPDLVRAAMARKKTTPTLANRIKEQAQAFVRDTLRKTHPLYHALVAIPSLTVGPPKFIKRHLTPIEFWALAEALGEAWPVFRDMALTGMIQREFWGDWAQAVASLDIPGTKNRYRVRRVPLIQAIARPAITQEFLMDACRAAGLRPYNARHSYARWLDEAGLPAWRQSAYMGHSLKGLRMTEQYQAGDVGPFLVADGAALRTHLGLPPLPGRMERSA